MIKNAFIAAKNAFVEFWQFCSWLVWFTLGGVCFAFPLLNHVGLYPFPKYWVLLSSLIFMLMVIVILVVFGTMLWLLLDVIMKAICIYYEKHQKRKA